MNAPIWDIGFTSRLGTKNWRTTKTTKNALKRYFREKELLKEYPDIADACRPNLAIFRHGKGLRTKQPPI